MSDTKHQRAVPGRVFAVALGVVSLITPLAVHLFLPAIPAVKIALDLSAAAAQFNFSVALLAMACATLTYGSLSDRLGRRPVLLSGLVLFLAGSAIAVVAQTALVLAIGRVVQAAGAGCGLTLVRTIARDAYPAEHLVRAIAYLTMFSTLGPMIAPLAGGMLIDAFGWRSVFAFALLAGAAITLAAYLWIGETRPQAGHFGGKGGILRDYVELFKSPKFVGYVLQSGLNTASFMTLASASASLMQELLQRSASEFGLYFLLFPLGFFLGNFVSSRIGSRSSSEVMVLSGSVLAFLAIFVQAMLVRSGMLTPSTLFIPGFLITFSQGISLPYAQVGAMAIVPRIAGTAAGVGVFMQNMGAAVFTQLYGLFADGTPLPMVAIMACSGMLCLAAGAMPILCGPRSVRG